MQRLETAWLSVSSVNPYSVGERDERRQYVARNDHEPLGSRWVGLRAARHRNGSGERRVVEMRRSALTRAR